MKLYWGWNTIPELQGLSKAQQGQLWREGTRAARRTLHGWAGYGVMVILYGIMYIVFQRDGLAEVPGGQGVRMVVSALIGVLIWFSANQVIIRGTRPFLATRRAAMEQDARNADGSYYVPPAF